MGIILLAILITGYFYLQKNSNLYISGAVVPHHDLVATKRAEFFFNLASHIKQPKTIILISPNHYLAGQTNIQTTDQNWNLGEGKINPNKEVISSLIKQGLVSNEPSSFKDEHGIFNILADIHKYFPKSLLVPIIFKETSDDQLDKLEKGLLQLCNDCLIVASVDFSHYQPAVLAQLHDDRSIRDLQSLNTKDLLNGAEVDSGPALALLAMWAKSHNTLHFTLKANTNSGVIFQNPDLETTTHIFGWYQKGKVVKPEQSVSFLFGGDMMFARGIEQKFGNDFNNAVIKLGNRLFWGTDASIINLEGIITNQPIQNNIQENSFVFKFSPSIIKTLSFLHINATSQANNHSDNAGKEGLDTTRSLLVNAKIQPFGGSIGKDTAKIAQFTGNGLSLSVIGINLTFLGQNTEPITSLISDLKKDPTMKVIVMPHWGTEYLSHHTLEQEKVAHEWIDAGADMVIGGHPHVIEDAEVYKNTPIIYSLGNLLFDQAFSRTTQEGLLIGGKFTNEGLTFFGLPTQSIKFQPQLMRGQRKKEILNQLYIPFQNYLTDTKAGIIVKMHK